MATETGEVGFLCIHVVHVEPCRLYSLMYRGETPRTLPHVPNLKMSGRKLPNPPSFHGGYNRISMGQCEPWQFRFCSVQMEIQKFRFRSVQMETLEIPNFEVPYLEILILDF